MKCIINGSEISSSSRCYIVAEISGNHSGDINKAKELIIKAHEAGVDAVKLQTYTAETITLNSTKSDFIIPSDSPWSESKTLFSLYEQACTPWSWFAELFSFADSLGITIFSSPFDSTAVELLESLNCPAYKIASPEITDIGLIARVARTGKPVILSTGLAELEDLELAVETLRNHGCKQFIILKCTTAYPTPFNEVNLVTISEISKKFQCVSGISDHTLGLSIPIAAVAMGAKFIEKHIKLDGDTSSVDSFFSLKSSDFKSLVDNIRNLEDAIGVSTFSLTASQIKSLRGRRSLYYAADIKKGEIFTHRNIRSVRPGLGLHPKHLHDFIGKKANKDIEFAERASLDDIQQS